MNEKSTNDSMKKTGLFIVIAFGLIACMLYGVGAAIRGNIGILVTPMAEQCGVDYGDVSFCVAVMNIVFGIVQPVFGALAAKTSNRFVLITGAGLLICSMIGMMQASPKMLAEQLNEMIEDKLIRKTIYPVVPPKTEYSLTSFGKAAIPLLQMITDYGRSYLEADASEE